MLPGQMLPGQMSLWWLASVIDDPRDLSLKFGQNQVNNSWDIPDMDKCRQDKCSPDKCHPWQLEYVQDGPRNLPLKFGQNRVSNSWDIADIEFVCVGGWVVVGIYSHFRVQPPTIVGLRLGCSCVGVLTIIVNSQFSFHKLTIIVHNLNWQIL